VRRPQQCTPFSLARLVECDARRNSPLDKAKSSSFGRKSTIVAERNSILRLTGGLFFRYVECLQVRTALDLRHIAMRIPGDPRTCRVGNRSGEP